MEHILRFCVVTIQCHQLSYGALGNTRTVDQIHSFIGLLQIRFVLTQINLDTKRFFPNKSNYISVIKLVLDPKTKVLVKSCQLCRGWFLRLVTLDQCNWNNDLTWFDQHQVNWSHSQLALLSAGARWPMTNVSSDPGENDEISNGWENLSQYSQWPY